MTLSMVVNMIVWFTCVRLYDTTNTKRCSLCSSQASFAADEWSKSLDENRQQDVVDRAPPPQHEEPLQAELDALLMSSSNNQISSNNYNWSEVSNNKNGCFVLDSVEFPHVARNLASSLSIPLIASWSDIPEILVQRHHRRGGGDSDRKENAILMTTAAVPVVQHVLSIVPYFYPTSYTEWQSHDHHDQGILMMAEEEYAIGLSSLSYNEQESQQSLKLSKVSRKRSRTVSKPTMKPFIVDFMPDHHSRLGRRSESLDDLLVRAVIPNKKTVARLRPEEGIGKFDPDTIKDNIIETRRDGPIIWDLTAGFGQDAWLLALKGQASMVHMVERDPIVACLVQDALRRLCVTADVSLRRTTTGTLADHDQINQALVLSRILSLEQGDGIQLALDLADESKINPLVVLPDIVYLDPMFPERSKNALVKKNMQLLHSLLGSQSQFAPNTMDPTKALCRRLDEEGQLLDAARTIATSRVVVKRPTSAPPIGTGRRHRPTFQVTGPNCRWDVYVL